MNKFQQCPHIKFCLKYNNSVIEPLKCFVCLLTNIFFSWNTKFWVLHSFPIDSRWWVLRATNHIHNTRKWGKICEIIPENYRWTIQLPHKILITFVVCHKPELGLYCCNVSHLPRPTHTGCWYLIRHTRSARIVAYIPKGAVSKGDVCQI